MAGGISTALITTVLGLVTAIPLLFAYTYISSKAENIVSVLEEQPVNENAAIKTSTSTKTISFLLIFNFPLFISIFKRNLLEILMNV